jgi:TnpA family transposase
MTDIENLMERLTEVSEQKLAVLNEEAEIKAMLLPIMRKEKISILENSKIIVNYVESFKRQTVDSTKLKKEHPTIAAKCMKSSIIDSYVRVQVMG